eukprot:761369-Hanusia_phi.AAC.5
MTRRVSFGDRGTEGKIKSIEFARTTKKPFLGICLGMQLAVVEAARNILGWKDAMSEEFDKSTSCPVCSPSLFSSSLSSLPPHSPPAPSLAPSPPCSPSSHLLVLPLSSSLILNLQVIIFMPEGSKTHMGGTMRLGTRRTILKNEQVVLPPPSPPYLSHPPSSSPSLPHLLPVSHGEAVPWCCCG